MFDFSKAFNILDNVGGNQTILYESANHQYRLIIGCFDQYHNIGLMFQNQWDNKQPMVLISLCLAFSISSVLCAASKHCSCTNKSSGDSCMGLWHSCK